MSEEPEHVRIARAHLGGALSPLGSVLMARHIVEQYDLRAGANAEHDPITGLFPKHVALGMLTVAHPEAAESVVCRALLSELDRKLELREALRVATARFAGLLEIVEDKGGPLENDRALLEECRRRLQEADR